MANRIERKIYILKNREPRVIEYVQGASAVPIMLTLMDYDIPENATARVYVLKPSGKGEYDTATIEDNGILIDVKSSMFDETGTSQIQASVKLGDKTLITFSQEVDVSPNKVPGEVPESENKSNFLDEYMEKMDGQQKAASEALAKIAEQQEAVEESASTASQAATKASESEKKAEESAEKAAKILQDVRDFESGLAVTATAYEPYRGRQTVTLAANGLPGIPVTSGGNYTDADGQQWVCDTIEYRNGQAVYVKRVWSKTFTGGTEEDWQIYVTTGYEGFSVNNVLPTICTKMPGFCNLASVHASYSQGIEGLWIGGNKDKNIFVHNSSFYDSALADKGLANWKTYLAAHPMTVMTYLTTPIETPLTDTEVAQLAALHTYKPTTTITNDAGAEMDVTYVADTKAYIDNKFAELQTAQAITNAQLI